MLAQQRPPADIYFNRDTIPIAHAPLARDLIAVVTPHKAQREDVPCLAAVGKQLAERLVGIDDGQINAAVAVKVQGGKGTAVRGRIRRRQARQVNKIAAFYIENKRLRWYPLSEAPALSRAPTLYAPSVRPWRTTVRQNRLQVSSGRAASAGGV